MNGSTYDALDGKATPPHAALFHNNHDGTFTNVTAKAGVANDRWGLGCAVGDYDNDGWPDLYVTNLGKNRLYHNNHDGTFTDVAEQAGVRSTNFGTLVDTGATFGDYDGDGKLDLFVAGYIHYDLQESADRPARKSVDYKPVPYRGINVMCGPRWTPGSHDHLFHNNGDGTFTDVSKSSASAIRPDTTAWDALFVDVNNDGKPDLWSPTTPRRIICTSTRATARLRTKVIESGYAFNADGREVCEYGHRRRRL